MRDRKRTRFTSGALSGLESESTSGSLRKPLCACWLCLRIRARRHAATSGCGSAGFLRVSPSGETLFSAQLGKTQFNIRRPIQTRMPPMNLRILSSYEPAPGDATVMPELYRRNASLGPSVIIVLGTYQGEQFLREQLESIAAQTHRNWRLLVSDDGSTDMTRAIVREFGAALESDSQLMLVEGPRRGCVANFLSAICDAPE